MIWLKRLFNLPALVCLHVQHSKQYIRVQKAQSDLHWACDQCEDPNSMAVRSFTRSLELELERMTEIDERIYKLWSKGRGLKID